jgi:hypothetical protein
MTKIPKALSRVSLIADESEWVYLRFVSDERFRLMQVCEGGVPQPDSFSESIQAFTANYKT